MKHPRLLVFVFSAVCLVAVVPSATPGTDETKAEFDYQADWYFTPSDFPCLTETIHVTGAYKEIVHVVINPSGAILGNSGKCRYRH